MKLTKIHKIIVFGTIVAVYGLGTIFYKQLKSAKQQKISTQNKITEQQRLKKLIEFDTHSAKAIYTKIKINPATHRNKLIKRLILPSEIVTLEKLSNENSRNHLKPFLLPDDSIIYKASYYGLNSFGIFRQAKIANKNKCLLIYNQGHGGNPFAYSYHNELSSSMLKHGCDILSLSMTGIGLNEGIASYPSVWKETLKLPKEIAKNHESYMWFNDPRFPNIEPMALMLSGNYHLISNLKSNYENVIMVGISGGGWYTVMLSALIPEISSSYSFAGTLPKIYRHIKKNTGDWEQIYSNFWKDSSYWQFYILSTFDLKGAQKRSLKLIYNSKDPCCYMDPYASLFASSVKQLSINGLTAHVLNRTTHDIDLPFFFYTLNESHPQIFQSKIKH